MDIAPVTLVQITPHYVDGRERLGNGLRRGQARRCSVSLILVGPRQREGIGRKVRHIPVEETAEQKGAKTALADQRVDQAMPAQAQPVDPVGYPAMAAGKVAKLVRQHRTELLLAEGFHQRQADHQIIAIPTEYAEPGCLHHAGVEVVGNQYTMKTRRLQPLAQLIYHGKQLWRLFLGYPPPLRSIQLDPQCLEHHPHQHQQPQRQLGAQCLERDNADHRGQQQADQHKGDVAVAQQRQRQYAHLVQPRAPQRLRFQACYQLFKLPVGHCDELPLSFLSG